MTLEEIRKEWERGLVPLSVIWDGVGLIVLVVLEKINSPEDKKYYLHRYMEGLKTGNWDVSVDGRGVDLKTIWKWLEHPKAIEIEESHEKM